MEASDGGGGMDHVAHPGGVETFPAADVVEHLHHVRHQHMVVWVRVPGPGRGVAGTAVDQPRRRRPHLALAPSPTLSGHPGVEEREGGVGLGIKDPVHVIGPADHPQHGDGLVRGDDEFETRALRGDEPCPQHRVTGAALGEHRPVGLVGDGAGQAQPRCPPTTPGHGRLAPGAVVGESLAREVIRPIQHRVPVIPD